MMRATLITPSKDEYLALFENPRILKRGGALSDITTFQSPVLYQKGAGLFSFLRGIGRRAIPFIMKNVVPEALDMGKGILDDVATGRDNFKQSLKQRGLSALKGVGRRATTTKGAGRIKKKKKKTRKPRRSKCYKTDVFG